jgi:hypothetical protein
MFRQFDKTITECVVCCDTIDEKTFVLYKDQKEGEWKSSSFCSSCVKHMIKTSWKTYVDKIEKADCADALKKSVNIGPPINFRDQGVPCENKTKEVQSFYYDGESQSAKLEGSLIGEERTKWWDNVKAEIKRMEELEKQKVEIPSI